MGLFSTICSDVSSLYTGASSAVSSLYTGVMTSSIMTTTESDMEAVGGDIGEYAGMATGIASGLGLEPLAAALGTAASLGLAMDASGRGLSDLSSKASKKIKVNSLLS
jgi:hypothetical protein